MICGHLALSNHSTLAPLAPATCQHLPANTVVNSARNECGGMGRACCAESSAVSSRRFEGTSAFTAATQALMPRARNIANP